MVWLRYDLEDVVVPSELSIYSIYIYIRVNVGHIKPSESLDSLLHTHTHTHVHICIHVCIHCILGLNEETMSEICDVVASKPPSPPPQACRALYYVIAVCKNSLSFEADFLGGLMLHTFGIPLSSPCCLPAASCPILTPPPTRLLYFFWLLPLFWLTWVQFQNRLADGGVWEAASMWQGGGRSDG